MKAKILVVDDEVNQGMLYEQELEDIGYEVDVANSGPAALEMVSKGGYNLVVLDIGMPVMDGIEAARAISEKQVLPIIIITAHTDEKLMKQAADAGVFGYLLKPATRERPAAAISTARARFSDVCLLKGEVGDLREALDARKLIERAKGILMRDMGVGEQEAYRLMKRSSSHCTQKLAEIARRLVALDRPPRR